MFNPNQESIYFTNKTRATELKTAHSLDDEYLTSLARYVLNTNIGSSAIFILAVITLVAFFFLGTGSSHAQVDTSDVDPGQGGSDSMEMLYLLTAVNKVADEDFERAVLYFDILNEQYSEFAPAYTGRAYVSLLEGNHEDALADATIAYELNPVDGAIYYILAEIHFAMESYNEASFYYEAYLLWVDNFEDEPILITRMIGEGSMGIMAEHLNISIAEANEEELV